LLLTFCYWPLTASTTYALEQNELTIQPYRIYTVCVYLVTAGEAEVTLQKATKQTLIFNPPAILIIHLKRFEQVFFLL